MALSARKFVELMGPGLFMRFGSAGYRTGCFLPGRMGVLSKFRDREKIGEGFFPALLAYHQWVQALPDLARWTYWACGWACGMDKRPG